MNIPMNDGNDRKFLGDLMDDPLIKKPKKEGPITENTEEPPTEYFTE